MNSIVKNATAVACSGVLICALIASPLCNFAWADEQDAAVTNAGSATAAGPSTVAGASDETNAEISALQQQIESSAREYDGAVAKQADLQVQIDENQASIDELNKSIPDQQRRTGDAIRSMYYMQQEGFGLLSMVLDSENLSDFITRIEYLDAVNSHNSSELTKLETMQNDLSQAKTGLETAKADADNEAERAQRALQQAQDSRRQAQEKAEAEAAAQAAAEAAALQAAQEAAAAEAAAAQAAGNVEQAEIAQQVADGGGTVPSDGVSWDADKSAFVSEWTGRIDAYLSGSPLAGKGAQFAEAAWNYGVDPRWSPAISNIESSKGLYNAGNCNAWGMSAVGGGWRSFGSWDEAIDTHVSYLARVYGSTCTPAAAQKYCPPTWSNWYSKVTSEMNRI